MTFEYKEAFKRNLGWVLPEEQEKLKNSTIAIAGMGGAGGDHAVTLARLGVENFHIADFDIFDYGNFNRQYGATIKTVGRPKVDVIREILHDINPNISVKPFPSGIDDAHLDDFLENVNVYVDGLDIFALDVRRKVFQACHAKGIPALTAAPLGMGEAFTAFIPGKGVGFHEYFDMQDPDSMILEKMKNDPVEVYMLRLTHYMDNIIRFIVGMAPSAQHAQYLLDRKKVDLFGRDLPSIKIGMNLAAGVMATNVLKILLDRGEVCCAPNVIHFDAYRQKLVKTWRPWGQKNPLLFAARLYVRHILKIGPKTAWVRQRLQERYKKGLLTTEFSDADMHAVLVEFYDQHRS